MNSMVKAEVKMTGPSAEQKILETAYDWQARMAGDELTDHEKRTLHVWLDANDAHRQAFERARLLWDRVGDIDKAAYPPEFFAALEPSVSVPSSPTTWAVIARILKNARTVGIAGGALATATVLLFIFTVLPQPAPTIYQTKVSELRDVTLADGSVITLGAKSKLSATMEKRRRAVVLLAGEAYFNVAFNPSSPFVVEANDTIIQVVGTEFSVTRSQEVISVAVVEGEVAVAQHDSATPLEADTGVKLTAGEAVRSIRGSGLSRVSQVGIDDVAAWRDGEMIYINATLAEIVADADRYYAGSIRITDEVIASETMNAVFDSNDIDGLLKILEEALPLSVTHWPDGSVSISGRS